MRFGILGPVEVIRDGEPLPLRGSKPSALLAVLLLHAGRVVSVERLVDDLWGDDVPETAVKMVQIYVSQLRKLLGREALETRPPGYILQLGDSGFDLHDFERLCERGRAQMARSPETAASAFREALGLWRGPALGECEEPFARVEAARLEEVRFTCLEDRIEADLACGRHRELVGELESLADKHALRPRVHGQLMLSLYGSGRHAEALDAYRRHRASLDELGIEPIPPLRELERRMLQQDPELLTVPARAAPQRQPGGEGPIPLLVGREPQLGHLHRIFDEVARGARRLVFVTGEAGAGKTTLVDSFLATAELPPGSRVARGQCIEHRGAGEPYLPVLEALGRLCRGPGGAEVVALLETHAPTWLVQLPAFVDAERHEALRTRVLGTTRERMLREMVELLDAIAADDPLVVVLEDLHWSDPSTLDLLDAVARRRDEAGVLVMGTFRPQDARSGTHPTRRLVQELRMRNLCSELALGGLDEGAVSTYLETQLPALEAAGVASLLHRRTQGNPLFVEKLVEAWVAEGSLVATDAGWRLDSSLDTLASHVPDSLRSLIAQRVDELGPDDRETLEAASVVGATFATSAVAAAVGRDETEIDELCDALARRQLFLAHAGSRTWPGGAAASSYAFTHDLCHEVLADALPPARKALLHRRIAAFLAQQADASSDELTVEIAWHAVNGNDRGRAAEHLVRAAARALGRNAPREAHTHLESALGMLAALGRTETAARLELEARVLLGVVEIALGGWGSDAAVAAYDRARVIAAELGAADELAIVLFRLATLYEFRGDYPASERLLDETLRLPVSDGAGTTRGVYAHELMACCLFHQGEHEAAVAHAEAGLSLFDGVVDPLAAVSGESPQVSCNTWAALALWHLGRFESARERAELAIGAALVGIGRNARPMAHAQAAIVALLTGDTAAAARFAEIAVATAIELGYPYWQAIGLVTRGAAAARAGHGAHSLDEIRGGIALARATGARMDDAFFLALLAESALALGHGEAAAAALAETRLPSALARTYFYAPELARLDALLYAHRGDLAAARAQARAAVAAARELGTLALELRAVTTAARLDLRGDGDAAGAARELEDVLARLATTAGCADVGAAESLLIEARAAAAGGRGGAR